MKNLYVCLFFLIRKLFLKKVGIPSSLFGNYSLNYKKKIRAFKKKIKVAKTMRK